VTDKVTILSLDDFLSASNGLTEALSNAFGEALKRRISQSKAAVEEYKKRLAKDTEGMLSSAIQLFHRNTCEHHKHRVVPIGPDDWVAVHNAHHMLGNLYIGLSKDVARAAFDNGMAVATGSPEKIDTSVDAAFAVTGAAMAVMSGLIARNRHDNVFALFADYEKYLTEAVNDSIEHLLTGKPPKEKDSDERCH
jgi:hypothetical protein